MNAAAVMWLLQVTLVHLYQAGMFADLDQIDAKPRATQPGLVPEPPVALYARPGAKVSIAEAPLREEVQNKLQRLPPALFNKCQQVHSQSAWLLPQLVMFIAICSFAHLIPSCNCPATLQMCIDTAQQAGCVGSSVTGRAIKRSIQLIM